MDAYDFGGWATRNNIKCADGRIIRRDAFKDCDGKIVPIVWNHKYDSVSNVLGHALLENRNEGVYTYCKLNDTYDGQNAKIAIKNGDITALSIYANKLKQQGQDVVHGAIREVSLVIAGANPGAYIDSVICHGEMSDEEAIIYNDSDLELFHSEENEVEDTEEEVEKEEVLEHADSGSKEDTQMDNKNNNPTPKKEKTVGDVLDTLTEEQKTVVYALIGQALESKGAEQNNTNSEEDDNMKHNVFDNDEVYEGGHLTHSDEEEIINLAKSGVGSFQKALTMYVEENSLQHDAFNSSDMGKLLPDYELIDPKVPKILYPDDTWVSSVINGVHKSPISRIRTRRADARQAELKAIGYTKGQEKKYMGQIKLLGRTHDAQTIYVKDKLNRDDILDITDFDIVSYQWDIMRHTLDQTLAQAILIGDGREDVDADKIKEDHIRPIWKDDDLYCIHQDVDIAAAKAELQGTETGQHFGDNYVYAEAIITAALYAREKYKGSGNLTFYCTPHLLNVMLLARDLNGRRIYTSKADLVAALNVKDIQTIEQFEGLTRTDKSKTKKLLGIFVNPADYQLGCVKGGEITKFEQFDIDFNQQKMLLETRVSGALVEWYSAIALEEDVTDSHTISG